MLLSVEIGRDNWPEGQTKVNVFLCTLSPRQVENHLWMVGTNKMPPGLAPGITKVGAPQVLPAGLGLNPEIVGKWTTQVYDLPPGTMLKLNIMRSLRGVHRSANIMLRVREGAPLQRIHIDTTPSGKRSKQRIVYEGRFDILTPEQARGAGYAIPVAYAPTYSPQRVAGLGFVRIETVAPETVSQPIVRTKRVINSKGDTVEVTNKQQKRALDL